jgi:hypothetical protein
MSESAREKTLSSSRFPTLKTVPLAPFITIVRCSTASEPPSASKKASVPTAAEPPRVTDVLRTVACTTPTALLRRWTAPGPDPAGSSMTTSSMTTVASTSPRLRTSTTRAFASAGFRGRSRTPRSANVIGVTSEVGRKPTAQLPKPTPQLVDTAWIVGENPVPASIVTDSVAVTFSVKVALLSMRTRASCVPCTEVTACWIVA